MNRRLLLGGAIGLAGVGATATAWALDEPDRGVFGRLPEAEPWAGSGPLDFAALRERAKALLTGGAIDPADEDYGRPLRLLNRESLRAWEAMDRAADGGSLWPDIGSVDEPSGFSTSYVRLRRLALAWATPGTDLYEDDEVADGMVNALALLYRAGYNEHAEQTGNWYWWEIGSASTLIQICTLLGERIPGTDLAHYLDTVDRFCPNADERVASPGVRETGANRADKAAILALRGLVGEDPDKLALARDGLSDIAGGGANSLFRVVNEGDGFHRDGSFIQHGHVPSTGSYGLVLLTSVTLALALLKNSLWEVTDPGLLRLYDAVEGSFAPFTEDGLFMDCLRGRGIARPTWRDSDAGPALTAAVTALAEFAPAEYRDRWRALARGWIERSSAAVPYFERVELQGIRQAKALLADTSLEPAPRPVMTRVYPGMDRLLVRRETWSWALSMSSNRVAGYEMVGGENLRGWYLGDGMSYLYTIDDPLQFGDEFWPTVSPYRLPGITVDSRKREVLGYSTDLVVHLPENEVAGGAALDDRYAVAAMDLIAEGSSLRAKKSWFVVDEVIVALGAGISAADGRAIWTTVEHRNRHADGDRRMTVDGVFPSEDSELKSSLDGASWVHLPEVAGYVFPLGSSGLHMEREMRSGAWNDIEQGPTTGGGDTEVHTRRYSTLWFDHGVSPTDAEYAYVLLPTASAEATAAWAAESPLTILANTAVVQAVEDAGSGLLAAHFWQGGEVGGLVCDGPASVLVRRGEDGIAVAVADPGRTAETVTLDLAYAASEVVEADDAVSAEVGDRLRITVATGGSSGATHTVRLR
ncbi:polysaccharide lyase 8 family protein [Glycomyces sp. TRM65418]|nr:polysaccharide lyase 8 family protein [Glycomyces sp. TRM65418]MCC3763323.1 polysaccharide lyase 8 family protein [Glycomyces sp. TRM65418]QZD57320.1 polysaccharide lyase 8 family protein [Glycomyces sp. TRM65418]